MTLNCAIIDDEPLAVDLLSNYVKKTPTLHLVGGFNSAITAIRTIRENPVDILFLDIQMPEISGLEFAQLLPEDTKIIFTTAFDQYAVQGFKVGALDYLLKPISYDSFIKSTTKAFKYFEKVRKQELFQKDKFIFVKSDYKLMRLMLDDILYIEGLKDYVKIFLDYGKKPMMSLINMKKIDEFLPHPRFLRVHRSFIVNMEKVKMVDRTRIVIGDIFIPISDSYKEEVERFLDSHTLM